MTDPDLLDTTARPRRRRHLLTGGALAVAVVAGIALTAGGAARTTATSSVAGSPPSSAFDGGAGVGAPGGGSRGGGQGGRSWGGTDGSSQTGSSTATADAASDAQSAGVVTITSTLSYESAESAGTGIVLTSGGEVLTNNHVIDGATSISVTVPSTGATYTATVVGTDATKDVAVLQLQDASGLTTATIADTAAASGDGVTAVGNAGGTGVLRAAAGSVTDLDRTITTTSEDGGEGETLHGLIETDADVVSGDSGGPLLDADGAVVGIDTAASSGSDPIGYAIPIGDALDVATSILAGDDTDEITIGYPAFLGVSLDPQTDQAVVAGVIDGTPAATSGLAQGDTVTAVGGKEVASADDLSSAIAAHAPGDRVAVTWTDTAGTSHTATVTLTEGPAD